MRDLLSELVRRTRHPDSTVQPRLTSRYEPISPGPQARIAVEDAAGARFAPEAPIGEPSVDAGRRRGPLRAPDPPEPRPLRPDAPTEDGPARAHPHVESPLPLPPRDDATPPRTSAVRIVAAAERHRPVLSTQPDAQAAPVPRPIERLDDAERRAVAVAARVVPSRSADKPPAATPDREPAGLVRDDAAGSEAPVPEIRISIGRIDVRAVVTPAAAVRRAERTRPPQSLEEYLSARARGGSR
jgi:hypothetical protein